MICSSVSVGYFDQTAVTIPAIMAVADDEPPKLIGSVTALFFNVSILRADPVFFWLTTPKSTDEW